MCECTNPNAGFHVSPCDSSWTACCSQVYIFRPGEAWLAMERG